MTRNPALNMTVKYLMYETRSQKWKQICLGSASLLLTYHLVGDILCNSGAHVDCVDQEGNTSLHIAARYGHELLIMTLLSNGADPLK